MIKVGKINSNLIGDNFYSFNYVKQPVTKKEELTTWRTKGYYHDSFTGSMYGSKNPMPDWVKQVSNHIGLANCGYTFYRMDTLDIMPEHEDHFETYCKVFKVDRRNVYRAILFLEDWKTGHYFDYNGVGFVNWNKGDYVLYSFDTPHSASNLGTEPRYTLQITGTYELINNL